MKKFESDKKINFSNESVQKPTIYDLFITAISSLQNVNKHSSEMKNKRQKSIFTTSTVFPAWSPFCMQAKNYDLAPSFSENYFWY